VRILIAEDNENSRVLLEAILEAQGHAVDSAENGRQALDMARNNPPDLIISDILMPEADGYSLCRAVKGDPGLRHIPFIFYTATYTDPRDHQSALDMGADRFLIKPMEPQLLLAEIEHTLNRCAAELAAGFLPDEQPPLALSEMHISVLVRKLGKKVDELDQERQRLQESEAKYRTYVDNSPLAIFMAGPDGLLMEANPAAKALTGRTDADILGRKLEDILHPADRERCVAAFAELRATGRTRFEATCARPGGQDAAIVIEAAQANHNAIIFCSDITPMKLAEAELARSTAEKEAMRREIHHRVKNNLQVICSLLRLQLERITDPDLRDVFQESESRIHAMALVHRDLYASDDLAGIAMQDFIESLALRLTAQRQTPADVAVDARGVSISIANAIPCGLLLNELLLNCMKHAFAPGERGEVRVGMRREGKKIVAQVADNGKGLPPDFDPATAQTLGMTLIMAVIRQLKGDIRFENRGGTAVEFELEEE
jgi:PAS domain S-box-containing protein